MKTRLISPTNGRNARAAYLGGVLMMAVFTAGGGGLEAASGEFPSTIPFDRDDGKYPEGVAVDKRGNVYVSYGAGMSTRAGIWKFTPSGEQSLLVDFGSDPAYGLATDARGNVYAGRLGGVDRVDSDGRVTRLPGTEQIVLANGLAFDPQGDLYVSESFSLELPAVNPPVCGPLGQGGIWRIPRGGTAELWVRDALLTGLCELPGFTIPIGANSIAYRHKVIFVVNSELGIIVRIPVLKDGGPGTPEIAATIPEPFEIVFPPIGRIPPVGDGLALDVHGNFYVTVAPHNIVARISADGGSWDVVATVAEGVDFPASLAFGTGKGERRNVFITNLTNALLPGAGPSLIKVDAGFPGQPLP